MVRRKTVPTDSLKQMYNRAKTYGEYRHIRGRNDGYSRIDPFGLDQIINRIIKDPIKKEKTKNPVCPLCSYTKTIKNGLNNAGIQRYKCKSCERVFLQPLETKKPKTTKEKPFITKTLNELKLEKEVKDLKAEIIHKNVIISNLKQKIKKLNQQLISPEQDKKRKRQIYIENPDFLEIT